MTIDQLTTLLHSYGLPLPQGTGRSGEVLKRDLERAIALHSLTAPLTASHEPRGLTWGMQFRMGIDSVMLAKDASRMTDKGDGAMQSPDYIAEEKLNGVRMLCCIDPEGRVEFIGRNIGERTCVPVTYTGKIAARTDRYSDREANRNALTAPVLRLPSFKGCPVVLDMEVTAGKGVQLTEGGFTGSSLKSCLSILSRDRVSALDAQALTPLKCTVFDILHRNGDLMDMPWHERRVVLESVVSKTPFELLPVYTRSNKLQFLNKVLAAGGEGVVLKRREGIYDHSGALTKDWIKVKRTVNVTHPADMDAFIMQTFLTESWSKQTSKSGKPLIGGIKLGVYLTREDGLRYIHHIATVATMPLEWRQYLTDDSSIGKVLTFDGMDVSAKNRRVNHARIVWENGFRDKRSDDCTMTEAELDAQIF